MKKYVCLFLFCTINYCVLHAQNVTISIDSTTTTQQPFYKADDSLIQYTGRIDFRNQLLPRMWSPGVYIMFAFTGNHITVVINDQELWGKNHNYLEVVLDGEAKRIQTQYKTNYITVSSTPNGTHQLLICKNTESNIGFIELQGVYCDQLVQLPAQPKRKIELYGNSITCGASADLSGIPCGKGVWQDQHNAYMAYGPVTARALHAQWQLSSVSGIGLIRSCCNMDILMPQVFDKIEMRGDSIAWNFALYQPDVVTVCLGQNDGIQDSTKFCTAYVQLIQRMRNYYPNAQIVLLSSPMADERLKTVLKQQISGVVRYMQGKGDKKISSLFFSRSYNGGCDYHPSVEEHQLIAKELTAYLQKLMHW
ncbi:MAG: acetyl xylan esterase [Bacteroidetes bacterium]|nr:acetyl xylan esterase [Bacteroidota bacterium]